MTMNYWFPDNLRSYAAPGLPFGAIFNGALDQRLRTQDRSSVKSALLLRESFFAQMIEVQTMFSEALDRVL